MFINVCHSLKRLFFNQNKVKLFSSKQFPGKLRVPFICWSNLRFREGFFRQLVSACWSTAKTAVYLQFGKFLTNHSGIAKSVSLYLASWVSIRLVNIRCRCGVGISNSCKYLHSFPTYFRNSCAHQFRVRDGVWKALQTISLWKTGKTW